MRKIIVAHILVVLLLINGCATTPSKAWGSHTQFNTNWSTIKKAAYRSFTDIETWAPLTAAAVFGLSKLDDTVLDYAVSHRPLFDTQQGALDASDRLLDLSRASLYITTLATPNANNLSDTVAAKVNGATVQVAALVLTNHTTGILKRETRRSRPRDGSQDAFPSAHASSAYVYTSLSKENLNSMELSTGTRFVAKLSLMTISAGTAWARVEAEVHYPSDVLLGAAIGNFFARFVNLAFIHQNAPQQVEVRPNLQSKQSTIHFVFRF